MRENFRYRKEYGWEPPYILSLWQCITVVPRRFLEYASGAGMQPLPPAQDRGIKLDVCYG